jgi:hypothetical protein
VDILPGNQLESASPTMIANGVNNAVVGGEVIQFETATQVSGYPNRWELTGIFRGLRRTELRKTEHAVGEPFMILDDSVQFTAMRQFDVDVARPIRVVTYEQDPTLALETTLTIRSGPKRPTAGATAETTATIRWVAVSAPDSQTLKYRELGTDTWTEIALSGGATDHDLTDLTAGETYETEIEAAIEGQIWTTTRISWPQWREIPAPDLSGLRASDLLTRFEDVAEDGEIMFDENGDVIIEEVPNE